MSRLVLLASATATLFIALVVIEQLRAIEPFSFLSLAVDITETAMLGVAVILAAHLSVETREMQRDRHELFADLQQTRRESDRWRAQAREHVDGLSKAIGKQFGAWTLTEAEADVAGLMLKGLSHKEIATLRGSAEATVRQHAAAVYRKSGLSSRAQLTAFFLEDLLAPAAPARPATSPLALVRDKDRPPPELSV